MPPHPFFRAFLDSFPHHLPPNAIIYLLDFISLCENIPGCYSHWGLFKHIFTYQSMLVKKDSPTSEKTHITQLCGGLGIQVHGGDRFPR